MDGGHEQELASTDTEHWLSDEREDAFACRMGRLSLREAIRPSSLLYISKPSEKWSI